MQPQDRDYVVETLDNGLRLAVLDIPHVHSTYIGAFTPGGPAYEPSTLHGIMSRQNCTGSVIF